MTNTLERLRVFLVKDYKRQPERLTFEAPLDSLGIDSLGTVELRWTIEDTFQIKLPPEPVALPNLADVVRYIDALMVSQAVAPVRPSAAEPVLRVT